MIIALQLLLSVALATPCSDGWESSSSGSGTCSHHGGIAGGNSGYYPTYVEPTARTTVAPTGWTVMEPSINQAGTLVVRGVMKTNDKMSITYNCFSNGEKQVGSSIGIFPTSDTGSWAPITSSFVAPADPELDGNNLVISLATGNSISRVKSWRVGECKDCLYLSKSFGDLVSSDVNAEYLTSDELQKFKTASYISVTVNEDVFTISLAGSAAAIASADAACNR
jgi:hypothetical protein